MAVADVSLPGEPVMSWGCVMSDYAGGKALTKVSCAGHYRGDLEIRYPQADGLPHTLHTLYS